MPYEYIETVSAAVEEIGVNKATKWAAQINTDSAEGGFLSFATTSCYMPDRSGEGISHSRYI
jgi:hypothetical protein